MDDVGYALLHKILFHSDHCRRSRMKLIISSAYTLTEEEWAYIDREHDDLDTPCPLPEEEGW